MEEPKPYFSQNHYLARWCCRNDEQPKVPSYCTSKAKKNFIKEVNIFNNLKNPGDGEFLMILMCITGKKKKKTRRDNCGNFLLCFFKNKEKYYNRFSCFWVTQLWAIFYFIIRITEEILYITNNLREISAVSAISVR